MTQAPFIIWFRDDLRLADNPALHYAAASKAPLVAVYILDERTPGFRALGGAARWWLNISLENLQNALAKKGVLLILRRGETQKVFLQLAKEIKPRGVFWNRRYNQAEKNCDEELMAWCKGQSIEAASFNGALMHEPWDVHNKSGLPFKVFTPYWKAHRARGELRMPLRVPAMHGAKLKVKSDDLKSWKLHPHKPDWSGGLDKAFTPSETGARKALQLFIDQGLKGYAVERDRPDLPRTSRLSPHLRFGELSPIQIIHAVKHAFDSGDTQASNKDFEVFYKEVGWRDFAYQQLYHFPKLASENYQPRFDALEWLYDEKGLAAWQRGNTGYPIIDAGMRQLWQTGWMHNRVRMITASFLCKHLMIDWRLGEQWFWDTLVDADPANNAFGWQWVAGSGADASPYFRVFNPILQGAKFDKSGDYVRALVPELKKLPNTYLHAPWSAPDDVLKKASVKLGKNYPKPIVDHASARLRSLDAFKKMRKVAIDKTATKKAALK